MYYVVSLVTLESRSRALVADDRVLDQTSAAGGNHHGLGRLGLNGQGCLAVGLNQGVDREALGLHWDPLGVHLHLSQINKCIVSSQHVFSLRDDTSLTEDKTVYLYFLMYCFQKNGISRQITLVRLTTVFLRRALLFVRMLSSILYFMV